MNIFQKIIKEICEEENIKCTFLSKNWITLLEKDNVNKYIAGYKFELNMHASGLTADDKYALYDVLKYKNIPIIEHNIVYNENNNEEYAKGCNTHEYVKEYFRKHAPIILKPNNGTCGHNVYKITDINEIDNTLDKIFNSSFSISMCPFYNIKHEYRLIMLDGNIELMYAKYLPRVTGDGKKTIRELLLDFNHDFFVNKLNDSKYNRVLNNGETFEYNWKFNLSQGSVCKDIDNNELKEKLTILAKKAAKEANLVFGSVDIIETQNNELLIMEINSGVMLDNFIRLHDNGYNIAKQIYKDAIKLMFKGN